MADRTKRGCVASGLFLCGLTLSVSAAAPPASIAVTEATNAQVAVSPDRRTLIADIQGLLFAIPMAGGSAKQLTTPEQEASHPEFSPKGNLVAIQSYAGGTFHIWTMRSDGSGLKQLTFGHGDDREPRISPDGTRIVFTSDRAFAGTYDLWTVPVAGGEPQRLTQGPDDAWGPSWTPDGKAIVYVSGVGTAGAAIRLRDLKSGAEREVKRVDSATGRLEAPSVAPDGKRLAYVEFQGGSFALDRAQLRIADLASGATLASGQAIDAYPFPAAWLDDKNLLYSGDGKILRLSADGAVERPIPFTAAIPAVRPAWTAKTRDFDGAAPKPVKGILAPALSPDGTQIAFGALNQLYVMPVGGKPVALTQDAFEKGGPAWSPDGRTLAYVSDRDGVPAVWLHAMADPSAASDRRLAAGTDAQIMPAWSPNGTQIAFQDQAGAEMLADVTTGTVRKLLPGSFFPGRAAFAPDGRTLALAVVRPYTRRYREGTSVIQTVDVASGATRQFEPAPFASVTTRAEDGPLYVPGAMLFVMDDLLHAMPVDASGAPTGPARKLSDEIADAPSVSADGTKVLFESLGRLRLLDRASGMVTDVPVDLSWAPEAPTGTVLIHAARVWTGTGPEVLRDADVLVRGHRIVSVGPHAATTPPGVDRTVEAPDGTVLPGLWENHAHPDSDRAIHWGARMGRMWLAYGITTVRGLASHAYAAVQHRESAAAGTAIGPRLFDTAEAIDGERVYYPMMIPTTSRAQLDRELTRLKALDADMVKLYVRLPYAWAKVGAEFAHAMGVDSASHYLLPAVALGEDGMSHLQATSRTGWAYTRSLTGHSYGDVRALLAQSGMWMVSTTFAQVQYLDDPGLATDPRQGLAPAWEHERLLKGVAAVQKADPASARAHLRDEESVVADVIRQGGTVLAGTDAPLDTVALSLHLNLRAQVAYGLAPWQALQSATSRAAKAYGLGAALGTLEPGKLADLIVVEGDPLTRIEDTARVQCVMRNGRLAAVDAIAAPFATVPKNAVCSE